MSLYDEEDLGAPPSEVATGWSSGLKMMQSQLQVKKPRSMAPPRGSTPNFATPMGKSRTFSTPILAPVIDLKSKRPMEESGHLSSQRPSKAERVFLQSFVKSHR